MKPRKCMFKGEIELYFCDMGDGTGALAPPEHIDSDGELSLDCLMSDSWGHVFEGGLIMRYRQQVGTIADLTFAEETHE